MTNIILVIILISIGIGIGLILSLLFDYIERRRENPKEEENEIL